MNTIIRQASEVRINWARGRAIAQAAGHWLPTASAQVRARVWSSGICDGQSVAGAGFLRGRYNIPEVADVPSGPSLDSTPHYEN
jgi:hypothetical protein